MTTMLPLYIETLPSAARHPATVAADVLHVDRRVDDACEVHCDGKRAQHTMGAPTKEMQKLLTVNDPATSYIYV